MPMNGDVLGKAIAGALGVVDQKAILEWCKIATAIVTHIQTTAVVSVPSVSGVTPGPGVSGPGAGKIT